MITPLLTPVKENLKSWEEQAPPDEGRQDKYVFWYRPLCRCGEKLYCCTSKNEDITQQEGQAESLDRFAGKVRKYLNLNERMSARLNNVVKRCMYTYRTSLMATGNNKLIYRMTLWEYALPLC